MTLIIAEAGHNHQGSLATANRMVEAAASAGADLIKFQKRTNRKLYTKAAFDAPYESENAFGRTYGEHREFLEFGESEFRYLRQRALELGIDVICTAFDFGAVDFCVDLEFPMIKIASGDLFSTPLIRYAAEAGKPLLISTGGGTEDDIARAIDTALAGGKVPWLCVMQCTASYPSAFHELDLGVIRRWRMDRDRLGQPWRIGASLHDNGIAMATAAVALGAEVIEKHFTLDRTMKGTDHAFSLEPQGLEKMVRDIRRLEVALGDVKRIHPSEEAPLRKMGKGIYARHNLSKGHLLTADDLMLRSPAAGAKAYMWDALLGATLQRDIRAEEPVEMADVTAFAVA